MTRRQMRRAEWLASLSKVEFETVLEALKGDRFWEAFDNRRERAMRQALRKRAPAVA